MYYKIEQDTIDINPRTEWDNDTIMICFHRRYNLGDEHSYSESDFDSWSELYQQLEKDYPDKTIKPLYLYEHSGLSISTGSFTCKWDSGQTGFIVGENDDIIESEINEYDMYLRGEIYYYTLYNDNGDIIDSCGGLLGYDTAENEAENNLLYYHNKAKKERAEKLKAYIRHNVPLQRRWN